jgi:hypothetical protein
MVCRCSCHPEQRTPVCGAPEEKKRESVVREGALHNLAPGLAGGKWLRRES